MAVGMSGAANAPRRRVPCGDHGQDEPTLLERVQDLVTGAAVLALATQQEAVSTSKQFIESLGREEEAEELSHPSTDDADLAALIASHSTLAPGERPDSTFAVRGEVTARRKHGAFLYFIDIANDGLKLQLVVSCEAESEDKSEDCLLYTSPSPRDKRQSRMPSSA